METHFGITIVPLFDSDGDQVSVAKLFYNYPLFDFKPDIAQFSSALEIHRIWDVNNQVDIDVESIAEEDMEYYQRWIYGKEVGVESVASRSKDVEHILLPL